MIITKFVPVTHDLSIFFDLPSELGNFSKSLLENLIQTLKVEQFSNGRKILFVTGISSFLSAQITHQLPYTIASQLQLPAKQLIITQEETSSTRELLNSSFEPMCANIIHDIDVRCPKRGIPTTSSQFLITEAIIDLFSQVRMDTLLIATCKSYDHIDPTVAGFFDRILSIG